MSGEILFECPFTNRQNLITFFLLSEGNVKFGSDMEVKASEAFDDGFDPTNMEDRRTTVLLPAAESIVKLEKTHEALGVIEQIF